MAEAGNIRIAIIGVTGVGKSALGNTILMENKFKSQPAHDSVTEKCESASTEFNTKSVLIVDTPGFNDTKREVTQVKKEISKSVLHLAPGPHAFLIVLHPNRFSPEEKQSFTEIENAFGSKTFYKHSIVVFTRKAEISRQFDRVIDFVNNNCCDEVKELVKKCKNRVISVENNSDFTQEKKTSILSEVEKLSGKNGKYFSHDYFKVANKYKTEKEKTRSLQQKVDELTEYIAKKEEERIRRESELKAKEQSLDEKKKQLEKREQTVEAKEKIVSKTFVCNII